MKGVPYKIAMETKYIDLRKKIDDEKLKEVAKEIKKGNLIIFPTETVYGVGANGLNEKAIKKIYIAKGRESDNPLILHISKKEMLDGLVKNIGAIEEKLIRKFWPGPLTIIFDKKQIVPDIITAGLPTVAIRMPSNEIARKLIDFAGVPIAAPSANISGKPSGTLLEDIKEEFQGKVAYMINGGKVDIGLESTVVRVKDNKLHILRPGKITEENFNKLGIEVIIEKQILGEYNGKEKVMSPGIKYKHYAPTTKSILVYSSDEQKMIKKIQEITTKNNAVILCKTRNYNKYKNTKRVKMGDSLEEISKNIFTLLRKADKLNKEIIVIEGVEEKGLGLAIMNRLIRACGHSYIKIK